MTVLIQRLSSGLFLKGELDWTRAKQDARAFPSSIAAMRFCLAQKLENVALVLVFESGTEVLLNVFARADLVQAVDEAAKLQEESRILIAQLDQIMAEGKERKKQYPVKPPNVRKPSDDRE